MGLGAIAAQIAGTLVGTTMSPVPMVALSVVGAVGAFAAVALIRRRETY
jgi:DHA1 family bicyclomycin/chloramphenicol resistance-like MFS transporter